MRIVLYGNFEVPYCTEVHHANSLESLGHTVIRLQENAVPADDVLAEALGSHALVWVHSHGFNNPGKPMGEVLAELKAVGIPTIAAHLDLYLPLQRWRDYEGSPYMQVQHFLTVDKLMAQWFDENTETKGHYFPPASYHAEAYQATPDSPHGNDVIFVGSRHYHHEWPYRPQLVDWLRDTYGSRFTHVGGDGDTGTIRGHDLNRVYASSKVAVGDTLCVGFDYPYYWSDRCPETLSRFGFLIHPHIRGMDEFYKDGEHLRYYRYNDFDQLRSLIDYYLADENAWERERIRRAGHEHVRNTWTYRHYWERALEVIFA